MEYIIYYLIAGVVLTMLFYRPQPGDGLRDTIADVVFALFVWPVILVMTILDTLRKDR